MKKTMKHFICLLFILAAPLLTKAAATEFSYDPIELNREFKTLNEISEQVDEQNLNYFQVMSDNDWDTDFELESILALKSTLNKGKIDWNACAWGFLCWPVGIFTVLINDDTDDNSKNTFCLGWASNVVMGTFTYFVYWVVNVDIGFNY